MPSILSNESKKPLIQLLELPYKLVIWPILPKIKQKNPI